MVGPQRFQKLERGAHRGRIAVFIVMLPRAKDGDAHPFQRADHKVGVVARDAGMGKARKVAVGDRHAIHRPGQMAKARAKDQAKANRF